jgi:excinuclease UvrABC nuclease subunit
VPDWKDERFSLNQHSVRMYAPEKPGVYVFFQDGRDGRCVYVGKTQQQTLRIRLLQHLLQEEKPCIMKERPLDFACVELPAERVAEQEAILISQLKPLCNVPLTM